MRHASFSASTAWKTWATKPSASAGRTPQMPAHLEAVVTRVHAELSDFKHKLH